MDSMNKYNIPDCFATKSQFPHEKNDCTVLATSFAMGLPYADAHARLRAWGRQDRQGIPFRYAAPAIGFRSTGITGGTCRKRIAVLPPGRYVIRTRGHVFGVVKTATIAHDGSIQLKTESYGTELQWNANRHVKEIYAVADAS
jgi:hypothetical protein